MKKSLNKGKFILIILGGLVYNIVPYNQDPGPAKTDKSISMEMAAKFDKPILDSTSLIHQNIKK